MSYIGEKSAGFSARISDKIRPKVSPIFGENDWKTIKWIAQHDDPANYWKVGDFKMLEYPEVTRPGKIPNAASQRDIFFFTGGTARPTGNSLGKMVLDNPSKLANVINNSVGNKFTGSSYYYRVFADSPSHPNEPLSTKPLFYLAVATNTASRPLDEGRITESMPFEELLDMLGMRLNKTNSNWDDYASNYNICKYGIHVYTGWTYEEGKVYPAKQYPIMILGFNHDDVTDVFEYGKQRAGMTLCLGISRGANGVDKIPPYNWSSGEGNILPNLYESGVSQFGSAIDDDTLMSPYHKGDGTNWKDSEFREVLQKLLDGTELEDKIVAVDKITAEGNHRADRNYFSRDYSSDKISLPSEYEIHGMVKFSCAQEGEWYDFFKRGKSRFFWDSRLCGTENVNILSGGEGVDLEKFTSWVHEAAKEKGFTDADIQVSYNDSKYGKYLITASTHDSFNGTSHLWFEATKPNFVITNSIDFVFKARYQLYSGLTTSQLVLWTRSPRGGLETEPLATKGGCALDCSDLVVLTDESQSFIPGMSITNASGLASFMKNLKSNAPGGPGFYWVSHKVGDSGEDEKGFHLYKNGDWVGRLSDSDATKLFSYTSRPTYTTTVFQDRILIFRVVHGKQVDYKPNAWGNSAHGTLLPIFCL